MTRRVVVTGLGSVCPVGHDLPSTWANLLAGESGVDVITRFDTTGFKVPLAAEVRGFDPDVHIQGKALRHMDRNVQFGLPAALEAVADAGLEITDENRDRVGVIFGSGGGGLETVLHWYEQLKAKGPRRVSPFFMPNMIGDAASGHIAITTGATGPNYSTASACASGANAVADGALWIKANKADAMIVGGSEAVLLPLFHAAFESMRVLAKPADPPSASCRPFDLNRSGFVPGEGGAALILEEADHARARGATIYAEVVGSGSAGDGFDMAAPDPSSRGLLNAMRQTLSEACIPLESVGYVNTHGTGTKLGDKTEVQAVKAIFGAHAQNILLSSIKPATGHMMGASGALEAIVTVLAIHHGIIPPTLNYVTPDPECDLDCVPNQARRVNLDAAMSVSVGLGGHNAALLLKRWIA